MFKMWSMSVPSDKLLLLILPTTTLQAIGISYLNDHAYCMTLAIIGPACFLCLVYFKQCETDGCDEKLEFDGSQLGLLNMKTFLVSYEVLRNYMYHFLLGR